MGIVRGLSNIQKTVESKGGGTRANWLSLKDGDSHKIRFLQELDETAEHYNPEANLGILVLQHRHPDDYKKRAVCTIDDEGRCFGCEQGWNQRQELFINVLVEDDEDNPVKVLNQGVGKSSVVPWLLEYAGDAGSITDVPFRIKRTGSGMRDTQYTLTPAGKASEPLDVSKYELFDLEKLLNQVPYDQQKEYFYGAGEPSEDSDEVW